MKITYKQYLAIGTYHDETIFYDKEQNSLLKGKRQKISIEYQMVLNGYNVTWVFGNNRT